MAPPYPINITSAITITTQTIAIAVARMKNSTRYTMLDIMRTNTSSIRLDKNIKFTFYFCICCARVLSLETTSSPHVGVQKLASWMTDSYKSKTKFGRKAAKTSKVRAKIDERARASRSTRITLCMFATHCIEVSTWATRNMAPLVLHLSSNHLLIIIIIPDTDI